MGKIQLEVLKEIVYERFNLKVDFGPCEIMYKERDFILFSDSVSSLLPDYFKRTGAAIIKESLINV